MTNLVSDGQTHKSPSRFWSAEMKFVTKVRSVGKEHELSSLDCLKTPKSDTELRNYSSFLPGLN
jgi:hypothetical protein